MVEISIDNSALCDALEDRPTLSRLQEAILARGRLVVTRYAIDECLTGESVEERKVRGAALHGLMRSLGTRLVVPPDLRAIFAREASGPLTSTPESAEEKEAVLLMLRRGPTVENLESIRRTVETHKAKWAALDEEVRREAPTTVPREETERVPDHLHEYSEEKIPNWIPRGILGLPEDAEIPLWGPDRYLCLKAYSALAHLNMFAAGVPDEGRRLLGHPDLAGILNRDRGNWYDAVIAASAAYGDVFLSSDRNLRRRCSFLFGRRLLRFRALSLGEFLGKE